jgi:hypothetical protein
VDERERERRWREGLIGLAFSQGAARCPSVAPNTRTPCRLPDMRELHDAGHEGWTGASSSTGWSTGWDDLDRWNRDERAAAHA